MKRILAIVVKDLRRVRPHVVFWAALLFVQFGLGLALLWGWPISPWAASGVRLSCEYAGYGLTFLIAAVMVQEDVILGTKSFWMTRPIAPWRLMLGKIMGVGLATVIVPVLLHVPWWLAFHFRAADLGWAALDVGARQVLAALPAVMMAVLTDTLSRVLVWTLVLVAAFAAGPLLWSNRVLAALTASQGLPVSRALFQLGILVLTGLVTTTVQFLTRRSFASIAFLLAGLAASSVANRWPVDFFSRQKYQTPAGELHPELGRDVTLTFQQARLEPYARNSPPRFTQMAVDLALGGVPPDFEFCRGYTQQRLLWPNGLKSAGYGWEGRGNDTSLRRGLGLRKPDDDDETIHWWKAYEEAREAVRPKSGNLFRRLPAGSSVRGTFTLDRRVADLVSARRPAYELTTEIELRRAVPLLETATHPGAHATGAGYQIRVQSAIRSLRPERPRPDGTVERLSRRQLDLELTSAAPVFFNDLVARGALMDESARPQLFLLNRTTGDLLWLGEFDESRLAIGGVSFAVDQRHVLEPVLRRNDGWVPRDPDFLEHASIALVEWRLAARVLREVKVEHLTLEERDENK